MSPSQKTGLSANWAVREVDHLIGRLSRYTRFVIYGKWSLAGFALVLLVALLLWPMLSADRSGMRISFVGSGDLPGKGSVSPTMESPVYEGADAKGQQYRITGTKATQVSEDLIVIDNVDGQLVHGNAFTSLRAQRAEYAQKQHYIDLVGDVQVMSGEGYHFTTPRARVDTGSMIVTGDEQVTGEGPMGNLLATGFEIRDNGKTVRFGRTGRVNVEIIRTENPS